jgi:PAS domain S-box-containing protein
MAPRAIRAGRFALRRFARALRPPGSSPSEAASLPAAAAAFGPDDAIAIMHAEDGVFVYTSSAWDELFGYARNELLGRHVSTVAAQDEEVVGERLHAITVALRRNGLWRGETRNVTREGAGLRCSAEITEDDDHHHGRVWIVYLTPFDAAPPSRRSPPASPASRDADR